MNKPQIVSEPVEPIEGASDSVFIICASYEERTTTGVRKLSSQYRTHQSIICRAAEYKDKGKAPEYFEEIRKRLKGCSGAAPAEVVFGIEEPISFMRNLDEKINVNKIGDRRPNVTVDVTTFPRQELLMLLRYIDTRRNRGKIRLLYAEPERYATEDVCEDDSWLTRGVRSVHSVPGFCGIQYPQLAKLLVVILGHEGERTHITVQRHQPDKLILIPQGQEQHHEGLKVIAERENRQIISVFSPDSLWSQGLPSRGVKESMQVVQKIYQQHRYTHNMFLAANGTKLQLIGAYLACRRIPEIQITYAVPAVYNWEKYSTGTGRLSGMILDPSNLANKVGAD